MPDNRIWIYLAVLLMIASAGTAAAALTDNEKLGKNVFFDKKLSINKNQACAACHAPNVGYTGPDSTINILGSVYEGSIAGRFGNRKPPAASYAGDSPVLYYNDSLGTWIGGMFWDGRATGWTLGDPLAEQAKGPFLNPLEQALPNASCVVYRVINSDYDYLYKLVWGSDVFSVKWPSDINKACSKEDGKVLLSSGDQTKVNTAYNNIARSIASYERSNEVSSFTSKYDSYLKGKTRLTDQEKLGLQLFEGKAKCTNCHPSRPAPDAKPPMFTDYTYDNLGIPKNLMNPFYYEYLWNGFNPEGVNWIDQGLGGFLKSSGYPESEYQTEMGKFKVATLRNVDKRPYPEFNKAYGHNGYFKSLKQIVHFYNTRDTLPQCDSTNTKPGENCWPAPEISATMNQVEVGNLGLTIEEEDAIVAFLKTLTDRDIENHDH